MEFLPKRNILITLDERDLVHLLHVIAPAQSVMLSTDLMGMGDVIENDEETERRLVHASEFMAVGFVQLLRDQKIPHKIEIVKFAVDSDSVGSLVCKRAEQLNAAAVVLAKHNKGSIKEFFVGSVTNYCTKHCKSPIVVIHAD
ncbi:hypothetical protein CEUSTIGMA_g1362.t1 [Chlamydomonas eustigma]|uniref:UspA domain-containing protein n=1 Tax=Chlamydomonas eustigma TaxID=1157962 RepID=A0A250WTC6_9CHLO|nr:hypothetical protein CEUSTIGMA_g1362.t1 [Chlamydomonas eustigma]|eukprot:GAX73912.1 hypothetical protein CEUSTIGMA_g1362.t1 [Chlamydomonas eustigma]